MQIIYFWSPFFVFPYLLILVTINTFYKFLNNKKSEENLRIKNILAVLCKKYDAEENQILLAFLLKHPAKILPVIGTSRAENIIKFKNSLLLNLEREDWFKLLEAKDGKEVD